MQQTTSHILMIRPAAFGYNQETAANNSFQSMPGEDAGTLQQQAVKEFDAFVERLRNEGVNVNVIDDTPTPAKPDAVFPNNWISFHQRGTLITYPMYSPARRPERNETIIHQIENQYEIKHRLQFEDKEATQQFLEGTGSMVLDRVNRIAYACISPRTDKSLFETWCNKMNYQPHNFHAIINDVPVYHTNVILAIGSKLIIACLDSVPDEAERVALRGSLEEYHELLEITIDQANSFAGNMLALQNREGEELMIMSRSALDSLTEQQKSAIQQHARIVASPLPTIEKAGGGSARCMIAEIFLRPK